MRKPGVTRPMILILCIVGVLSIHLFPMSVALSAEDSNAVSLDDKVKTYMETTMSEQHIAGAVVTVVRDGKVVLNQGYGYADAKNQKRVDPNVTLFRIGSVSKIFTAVAAMQQVEQNHIDLFTDVNQYLEDMQIPNSYTKPLTLDHLLTQTGGFAENVEGLYHEGLIEQHKPIVDTLREHLPPLKRPPGEVVQYSNYGYTLIGHLVEETSKESFEQYLTDHIFQPLQMHNSYYALTPDFYWLTYNTANMKMQGY